MTFDEVNDAYSFVLQECLYMIDRKSADETKMNYTYIHKNIYDTIVKCLEEKRDSLTVKYKEIPEYGDLMTVEEFKDCVECGAFIDDDGDGEFVVNNKIIVDSCICPSDVDTIPEYVTHICWYNR